MKKSMIALAFSLVGSGAALAGSNDEALYHALNVYPMEVPMTQQQEFRKAVDGVDCRQTMGATGTYYSCKIEFNKIDSRDLYEKLLVKPGVASTRTEKLEVKTAGDVSCTKKTDERKGTSSYACIPN